MSIVFNCTCGRRLRAGAELAGRKTRCPACGTVLEIPAPARPEAAASAGDADLAGSEGYSLAAASAPQPGPSTWQASPGRAVSPAPTRPERSAVPASSGSSREFLYLALALALVPLGFSLLGGHDASVGDRLERTVNRAGPEVVERVEKLIASKEGTNLDDLLAALPGDRLDESAHLPRQTARHWVYGALAACGFWAFIVCLFPGEKKTPLHLLLVGLGTGTVGILLLLSFQYVAGATQGVWLQGRSVIVLLFYIAKFIGWSYASASDPNSNFLLSFIGFTCGVGLCEELCKALPVIVYFRRDVQMGWREACVWGLASGIGFGVSEGIMYSANHYNGISPAGIYVVRFVSCVALHALWTASVGITIWRRQETIQGDIDWTAYSLAVLRMLAVPMVLHGLYDTLLKKEMNAYALLVGLASFAWFTWQVESARKASAEEEPARGWAGAYGS
jgi:RsiW-degrading membrane proteinase PrsW (M82 family)